MKFVQLNSAFPFFVLILGVGVIGDNVNSFTYSPSSSSHSQSQSQGALSFAPGNVQKIDRGDEVPIVAVEIPDEVSLKYAYPNLKLLNDSAEEEEAIAPNSTLISGVLSKYRGRSIRSPYQSVRMGYQPSYRYYGGGRYRYNRFDGISPSGIDSGDSSNSWGSNWFNKLRRRTSMMMSPMTMSSYDKQQQQMMMMNQGQVYPEGTAEEPDTSATFIGSGWGGGGSGHYGKGVNKSAVGLLGFLSLLSLIQNVLNQTSMAQGGRRRRDLEGIRLMGDEEEFTTPGPYPDQSYDYEVNPWAESDKDTALVVSLVLPMLNDVNQAEMGLIPVNCVLPSLCAVNKALFEGIGERGKILGVVLSESASKILKRAAARWKKNINAMDISEIAIRAGKAGRIGKNCEDKFMKFKKDCRKPSGSYAELDLRTALRFMDDLIDEWELD